MATVVFERIGATIGFAVGVHFGGASGGVAGAEIGSKIGAFVGSTIDAAAINAGLQALMPREALKHPSQGDQAAPNLNWGQPIPYGRGLVRVPETTLFWGPPLRKKKTSTKVGGKGGGQEVEGVEYRATCAYGLLNHEIAGVRRIWFDGKLVCDFRKYAPDEVKQESADFADKYLTIYLGTEDQPIDPTLDSYAPGLTSAHRGMAYLVVNDYPISTYTYPVVSVEMAVDGSGERPVISAEAPLFNIVSELCLEAGLSDAEFSIDDLGDSVRGVVLNEVGSTLDKMAGLMAAHFFKPTSRAEKIHFLKSPRPIHRPEHSVPAVIGETGLIVNAFHDIPGREGYFDPNSGTSEGQLMMVRAAAKAATVLTATDPIAAASYQARAVSMAEAALDTCYLTDPPAVPALWPPHWLFSADKPVRTQTYVMAYPADFVGGVVTIPEGAPWYGEKVRTAIKAYANDGSYPIWDNPYAEIVGSEYAVTDVTLLPGTGAQITIEAALTTRLPLVVIYDIGEEISVGEKYEAWPNWRVMLDGEVACAADSMAWALDAYSRLFALTANSKWDDAFEATKFTIEAACDVDDGRAMFRPQATTSAFSLSGTFEASARPGMSEANWTRDPTTGVIVGSLPAVTNPDKWLPPSLGPANAEAQIGRGITDTWRVSDTHIRVTLSASEAVTVYVWLDTAPTYDKTTRFYAPVTLAGTGETLETIDVARVLFQTAQGAPQTLPIGATLYAFGISDFNTNAKVLYIKEARPIPAIPLPWTPYVMPFTVNVFADEIIDWRGSPGSGYQYPNVWGIIGNATGLDEVCDFLDAAQDDYEAVFPGNRGPFSPVYVWDRPDGVDLGAANTWTWNWYDPNTEWGGYQYRPLENTARAAYEQAHAVAKTIATDFLTWIDGAWTSSANPPPTNFPSTGVPTADYDEPHFAALILRAALWGHLAGISAALCEGLVQRAWDYLETQYVAVGGFAGTWSPNENDWFGFWHAEIIEALAMLLDEGDAIRGAVGISSATVRARLVASDIWITQNTRVVENLTEDEFGVVERDNDPARPFMHKLVDAKALPSEVRIHYQDVLSDYAINTRSYFPPDPKTESVWDYHLPLAMTGQEALALATRLGRIAEQGRDTWHLVGSLKHLAYEAGDAMVVELGGETMRLTLEGGAFGWPGLMPMDLLRQDERIYRQSVRGGVAAARTGGSIQNPGVTDHIVLDIPLLTPSQAAPGLFVALSGTSGAWTGAALYRSLDGGITYDLVATTGLAAIIGSVSGILPAGPTEIYDRATTITVEIDNGELESISEDLLLEGGNLCAIGSEADGWEILQFRDAVLIDTLTYELSFLLRGRRGTEHKVSGHAGGEKFVLLNSLDVYLPHALSDLGAVRKAKAVSDGTDIDDAVAFDLVNTGIALLPYSPVAFEAARDGGGNITFTWLRRDRAGQTLPWSGQFPLSETSEKYEVDILDGGTVVRTISVTAETAAYSAAQQIADFGGAQDPVTAEVFQIGAIGRGIGNKQTL